MKRLLFVLFSVALSTVCSYSFPCKQDDYKDVPLRSTTPYTRSEAWLPQASVGHGVLSVSFDAFGMYTLYIEDSSGVPVYTSTLPADGMEYSYDLSGIGEGMFILKLDGPSGEYEGCFII